MRYTHNDQKDIRNLLVGRSIAKIEDDTLLLDNGVKLRVGGNYGCGGCSNGNYDLTELNECPNMIMAVMFQQVDLKNSDWYSNAKTTYSVFVYAENKMIKLMEFEGTDGNGYYGTGYWIEIIG